MASCGAQSRLRDGILADDPSALEWLVARHGAQILDTARPAHGVRVLGLALTHGSSRCVRAALRLGAHPDFPCTPERGTALHAASLPQTSPYAEALIAAGADINARDFLGCTPVHCAALNDNLPVLRALLDAGALINASNHTGNTPLHVAAAYGRAAPARRTPPRGAGHRPVGRRHRAHA